MHVYMADPSNITSPPTLHEWVIRTSGMYNLDASNPPPVGPNDHPFFASCGSDGYFTDLTKKTDRSMDNMYSFQAQ